MRTRRFAIVLLVAGCGSGSIGGGTDPNGFNTAKGSSVLVAGVTQVTLTSTGGGFVGGPPAGAACDPQKYVYTVNFADESLAAQTCSVNGDWSDPASFVVFDGVIPLDASQWSTVEAAIAAVTVTDNSKCGADAASRNLVVAKPAASITYGDDFYGCLKQYDHYVSSDDLYTLESALGGIPH
jgi:hypothetical protein